jgi:hypothetical protein
MRRSMTLTTNLRRRCNALESFSVARCRSRNWTRTKQHNLRIRKPITNTFETFGLNHIKERIFVNKFHLVLLGFGALYAGLLIRSALRSYANLSL